jgi:hypothetical protein
LFIIPLKDGEFYYYRNGFLINNELYWRDQKKTNFDNELGLYRRFQEGNQNRTTNIFIYFGHQIPEIGGTGYDASYPERIFTIHDLANGLKNFTRDFERFDLLILSTCFGGTPYTIGALETFAKYIIASPENLHLSYFDLKLLKRLDLSLREGELHDFAKLFALEAFERLTTDVETAVSVAVYDVNEIQDYLHSVYNIYNQALINLRGDTRNSPESIEHCDCAEISDYMFPTINKGVEVFYRPASFGRGKNKQIHSGWQCWRFR